MVHGSSPTHVCLWIWIVFELAPHGVLWEVLRSRDPSKVQLNVSWTLSFVTCLAHHFYGQNHVSGAARWL